MLPHGSMVIMLIYTVKSGDTLNNIARRFGLSPNRLIADNQLSNPSTLVVGQNLLIMSDSIRYILEEGQTLYSLSQEYGVPPKETVVSIAVIGGYIFHIHVYAVIPFQIKLEQY